MFRFSNVVLGSLRRIAAASLFVLLGGAGAVAHAAGGPDCSRPLTLGLHVHGLLYSAKTGAGIDKDISDALARRSGCAITTTVLPRARIWQLIESGALDFSLSGITTPERERFAAFAWYFSNHYYLLVRRDAGVEKLSDFDDNPQLQLGVIRSFRYGTRANQWVDQLTAAGRVSHASGLEPLYQVLMLGRIHGMIIEPFDMMDVEGTEVKNLTRVIALDDPAIPHGLIMSKKSLSSVEQARWRALMDDLRQDGTVLRIFEKYFSPELARAMVNF
ncbi:MAG: transporter substrate-binding protein [Rhodoferax sp.]|nr:transporter substrate-binding protein [Rhodoferax sp.]